jgi:transcriptional repressor NrdR
MRCPYCSFDSTRVVDSRLPDPGDSVRRRRECEGCGTRFTTYERAESVSLGVRKRDGSTEPFDRQKLLGGLVRAVTKRPVTVPQLEAAAAAIEGHVRSAGGELDSERIGELALRALIGLDRVAAIRFASVYRNFEGLDDFEAELRRLAQEPSPVPEQLDIGAAGGDPEELTAVSNVLSGTSASIANPSATRVAAVGKDASTTTRREHAE